MKMTFSRTGIFLFIFLTGCARAPLKRPQEAFRQSSPPSITFHNRAPGEVDDLPLRDLIEGIEAEIAFLESRLPAIDFQFGDEKFTQAEYIRGLKRFIELAQGGLSQVAFYEALSRDFDFYEVYGQKNWGEVFITSYYEPLIQGSTQKTSKFTTPLYRTPSELVHLDLSLFDPKYALERHYRGKVVNQKLIPFDTRKEIDSDQSLAGKDLEICWVDPIDAFFLQIQGSGTVYLESGQSLVVNYADQNGQDYQAIGKYLIGKMPLEKINLFSIEAHLRTLSPSELQAFLNQNPSYVFFKLSDQRSITYLGTPAIEGRTIATDHRYFPKGALAFLEFQKPSFETVGTELPTTTEPTARWVLDQDRGGAITGGGRVDLFWGKGELSKKYAGMMKGNGRLTYLAPKRSFLNRISTSIQLQ